MKQQCIHQFMLSSMIKENFPFETCLKHYNTIKFSILEEFPLLNKLMSYEFEEYINSTSPMKYVNMTIFRFLTLEKASQ